MRAIWRKSVGSWRDSSVVSEIEVYLALERFGYDIAEPRAALKAFQRRWRPRRIDGELDGEGGALLFELLLERDLGLAR